MKNKITITSQDRLIAYQRQVIEDQEALVDLYRRHIQGQRRMIDDLQKRLTELVEAPPQPPERTYGICIEGIDLQARNRLVHSYELTWTPANLDGDEDPVALESEAE